jgi:hypothetical protein
MVFHYIASGLIGMRAFSDGIASAGRRGNSLRDRIHLDADLLRG